MQKIEIKLHVHCWLSGNQNIFLVQFGINKHWWIFQRLHTHCTHPMGSSNFVSIWKFYLCLSTPNCTRNHLATEKILLDSDRLNWNGVQLLEAIAYILPNGAKRKRQIGSFLLLHTVEPMGEWKIYYYANCSEIWFRFGLESFVRHKSLRGRIPDLVFIIANLSKAKCCCPL